MTKTKRVITDDEFDGILLSILEAEGAQTLLMIPGVYEILSEYYNNDVLGIWEDNLG